MEQNKRPSVNAEVYKQILNGKVQPPGLIIQDKRLIKFFLFNLDDIEHENQRKLELVANLFHEIRHPWQFKNNLFEDEEEINNIDENLEKYFNLPSEKDAYLF
ncbi:hypothetical protein [Neobacillus niacini]|uniref:hypothetical protein n=1 Tax=Neobacillus niacini TaxID=86668 RepID=UPI002865D656|nr:hypothetical protein [Neobacillus niacini]MDR6999279.1 hypothetical protein [Neobacillus niacini]